MAWRKHIHVLEETRALRFQAKIPLIFWGYCGLAVVYLINIIPNSAVLNQTPYEKLYGIKPMFTHLGILGCLCYA